MTTQQLYAEKIYSKAFENGFSDYINNKVYRINPLLENNLPVV
jgi:hypothetical protein